MLRRPAPLRERLWYFPNMPTEPPSTALQTSSSATGIAASRSPTSFAARHARALYRPVPPVSCDDDGYPETDSAAVESTIHEKLRRYAIGALRVHYAAHAGFFVAADLGLFFERGNRSALVAPDLMVAFGAGGRDRGSYKRGRNPSRRTSCWNCCRRGPGGTMSRRSPASTRRLVSASSGCSIRSASCPARSRLAPGTPDGIYAPVPALPDGGFRSRALDLDLVPGGDGFRFRRSNDRECPAGPRGKPLPALKASEAMLSVLAGARRRIGGASAARTLGFLSNSHFFGDGPAMGWIARHWRLTPGRDKPVPYGVPP